MASYIDINGATQQVNIQASDYRRAAESGLTLRQLVNREHPTAVGAADAWTQLCSSEGMYLGRDNRFGIAPSTMDAILNGSTRIEAGGIVESLRADRGVSPVAGSAALVEQMKRYVR